MSVIGVDPATIALIIRNPWGTTGWQNWQTVFEVSLDTLVTYGDIITIDNAGTFTRPSFSSAIVKGWYQAVQLQNAPSASVGDIVASLNNGTQTQTKIWTDITSAPYTSNYLNPAISAFQAALNRIPDQAGEQYWVDQLAVGLNLKTLYLTFGRFSEFQKLYHASGDAATTPATIQ